MGIINYMVTSLIRKKQTEIYRTKMPITTK